ncbi:DUF590-domain-containing protein [Guyanagaster necrorhizus]|uniref:DUF590-domain-containing protein n=1 Tax=Guyanagaster necrorhizus TaxID=856835 RepID=A0A9P7VWT4_9AGAR|nr:DUF590-domain-containing protein [Guyanagaster necrorhizus MCA 3950]KAG7448058.1 DUF590-domain-containing protein [Guyanagaster necrorhizus MCA 3950]
MPPQVDLVITFRASQKIVLSKQQIRDDAQKAEQQYACLLQTLKYGGLRAVARRGETLGHLLIFVYCPEGLVKNLVKRERHSDFLSGLLTTPIKSGTLLPPLSISDRLRLVHSYITSTPTDGGLGITPETSQWDLVESVMCLHDRDWNEQWKHTWKSRKIASVSEDRIRDQFGDTVALYFSFLHSYTRALIIPAILGAAFYFFCSPYSPVYSSLLLLWSVTFVEWWRVQERIVSLRFGTRGSFRVEKRRAQYNSNFSWWKRELRILASLPVVLLFAGVLVALLTAIFVFEAFVTQLYTGPGHKYISLSPTILFAILVPRLLDVYQVIASKLTAWENHAHYSSYTTSLSLKTFVLTALVAYLGLALSAFVYVPFGEGVMRVVQSSIFYTNSTSKDSSDKPTDSVWESDVTTAGRKLNPERLRDQMFAYTVTNQVVDTLMEIGLPFVLRAVEKYRNKKKTNLGTSSPKGKKKVVFEDEKEKGGAEEREFLERVRSEVALPEYDIFGDYNEMVIQFGYVALWSTIWPLAPLMALVNNFFELRSDAFKIITHVRRPIPMRVDTIGPWLDALTFLSWLSSLTNASLVYLFCPRSQTYCNTTPSSIEKVSQELFSSAVVAGIEAPDATMDLLKTALLIAFAASHGYMLLRVVVRHVVERIVWKGSEEVKEREKFEREMKESFLKSTAEKEEEDVVEERNEDADADEVFWNHDEGLQEIQRISKEA